MEEDDELNNASMPSAKTVSLSNPSTISRLTRGRSQGPEGPISVNQYLPGYGDEAISGELLALMVTCLANTGEIYVPGVHVSCNDFKDM